ncbi:MAG: hypothetical protein ACRD2R_02605 [Terriglobales bacterium]
MLVRTIILYGVAFADSSALALGLAASFIILAGMAGLVAGRILQSIDEMPKALESRLWSILGGVAVGAGLVPVFIAFRQSMGRVPTLDDLAVGLSGAFAVMAGVIAFVGERVISHLSARR